MSSSNSLENSSTAVISVRTNESKDTKPNHINHINDGNTAADSVIMLNENKSKSKFSNNTYNPLEENRNSQVNEENHEHKHNEQHLKPSSSVALIIDNCDIPTINPNTETLRKNDMEKEINVVLNTAKEIKGEIKSNDNDTRDCMPIWERPGDIDEEDFVYICSQPFPIVSTQEASISIILNALFPGLGTVYIGCLTKKGYGFCYWFAIGK